jgi:pimeloyl-ACP methyl ester carboxylesterase
MILHAAEAGQGAPLVLLHGLFGAARNFGVIQRRLARRCRTIALDLRNHGDSPHDADMRYPTLAGDVLETLAALDALPCALLGHSMGGKVAMTAALTRPAAVTRLLVSDIAPVVYASHHRGLVEAMLALDLAPGLTRAAADAALARAVATPAVRAFLLQNLRFGPTPAWRFGLTEIANALPMAEGWEIPPGSEPYPGPTLFVAGATSDYILPAYRPAIRALFPAARFVTMKGVGHWVHADNPDGFASIVEAFLAS